MPMWKPESAKRAAVELHSEDEISTSSGGSREESGDSSHLDEKREHTSAQSGLRYPSRQFAEHSPRHSGSPVALLMRSSTAPSYFTAGAALHGSTAAVTKRLLMGPSSPRVAMPAVHSREQSAREPRLFSDRRPALPPPRSRSVQSSLSGSFAFMPQGLEELPITNILVLGAPQVGKSHFINIYRAAVMNTTRWPAAPVGVSGFFGTTTVDPFPNHPRHPTWLCIDTPGRLYTGEHEVLLEKLIRGVPWKTKLIGPHSLTLDQLEELSPAPANSAHQCIVVVPATDLIEDAGWFSVLQWRGRYRPADHVAATILYLRQLISTVRGLMHDNPPFVVVSKMDQFGGAGCRGACAAVVSLLRQCAPVNRLYFTAVVEDRALLATGRAVVLERSTKQNLVKLHDDICLASQWRDQMDAISAALTR